MHLPLSTICSLAPAMLVIPAFFSSANLLNNEDDKMKEEGQEEQEGGLFKMSLK